MLYLTIFLLLLLSAKTQNLSDVNYSFDIDFYRKFDTKRCDGRSAWRFVRYDALNIKSSYADSDKGIQASRRSCASSFPIIFFCGIVEIDVYIRASSQKFGISVEAFDEDDTSISRYLYGRSSEEFEQGWRTISLQIKKHAKGYIQLRGTSLRNEIVVIDSFRYKPNITNTRNFGNRNKRSVNDENGDEKENIYDQKVSEDQEENVKIQSTTESGNERYVGEEKYENRRVSDFEGILDYRTEAANETNQKPDQNDNSFWNLFIIFFITFALVILALIIGVSAYNCGKIRAMNNNSIPPIFVDDLEPARTITIPRVTGTCEMTPRFTELD